MHTWRDFADDRADELFMTRIGVAVQKTDRDCLDALVAQFGHQFGNRLFVWRPPDASVGVHPLVDFQP